ncbi:LAFE_0D10308g1_1 [Lachancea fermentati]|uniref:LAFE_0D10308g1_1 n=1 Tax=Lachancea fermentati TaxID=4955 RepID=A0A1G4MBW6_LACFM|nr:LAFE_0D10308g1_1 [Lachancea fermentati]
MEQLGTELGPKGTSSMSHDDDQNGQITTSQQPIRQESPNPSSETNLEGSNLGGGGDHETHESLIENTDLKLDLPGNLDHEDFSKLLELDSKNDDDLFSSTDILEHNIPEENGSLTEHHTDEPETPSKDEKEQKLMPLETMHNLESTNGGSIVDPEESSLDPLASENVVNDVTKLAQVPSSSAVNTREGTATSILEETDKMAFDKGNDILASSAAVEQELPHEQLEDTMGSLPPDTITGTHLEMTQFHDTNINDDEQSKISAYARLDFQSFTFYVQTLQVIIGRRSENDFSHKVDVNLGPSKSISRKHAQIFYNFGTGRFELSIMGKNGAFVDDTFVERGITVPLKNKTKVQIGQIPFQFVLPDQDGKDKKSIAPTDAISLKVAQGNNGKIAEQSKSTTPQPAAATRTASVKQEEQEDPDKKKQPPKKKDKKVPKPPKPPKKVYTLEEIPVEYRTKPACSYSNLITTCLRKFSSPKGMSLSEIYAGIRELFPYYKYCPDGWQSSVRHNLSLNKSFRKVSKEGKGWLWGLDEEYIAERERQKKKQAEAAAAKAKAAQLKLEQQQQQKAKKAAAAAAAAANDNSTNIRSAANIPLVRSAAKQPNISQTLAANRADRKASADANQRTMKYLQEQLMILTKDRKGLDKQVMASILTQALAMTINQVTQAAKSKGITGNPLTALIDKNPQHLNLILAAAVNAATVKVTNGEVKQLVAMPPPTIASPIVKKEPSPVQKNTPANTESSHKLNQGGNGSSLQKNSDGFDPSSLSKFFQPKQPARVSTPAPTRSVLPQKRTSSESESSSEEESTSDDESGSDGSDSDDSNTDDGSESTDNSSSSGEDTSDEE